MILSLARPLVLRITQDLTSFETQELLSSLRSLIISSA